METSRTIISVGFALALTSVFADSLPSRPRWNPINAGLPSTVAEIRALTVAPSNPSTVYAVTSNSSLLKSVDAGGSWKPVSGITGVIAVAVDPDTSSTVYAATRHGIVKSTDDGANWNAASAGLGDGSPRAR